MRLAQLLAGLAATLCGNGSGGNVFTPAAQLNLDAGCVALRSAFLVGCRAGLKRAHALQLSGAASLLYKAGRMALDQQCGVALRRTVPSLALQRRLLESISLQLDAAESHTMAISSHAAQPDVAAALIAILTESNVLQPWLRGISDAITLLGPAEAESEEQGKPRSAVCMPGVWSCMQPRLYTATCPHTSPPACQHAPPRPPPASHADADAWKVSNRWFLAAACSRASTSGSSWAVRHHTCLPDRPPRAAAAARRAGVRPGDTAGSGGCAARPCAAQIHRCPGARRLWRQQQQLG